MNWRDKNWEQRKWEVDINLKSEEKRKKYLLSFWVGTWPKGKRRKKAPTARPRIK